MVSFSTLLCTSLISFQFPRKIVLVGMPGVGKTTLAKQYNAYTKTPFFDTDAFLSIPPKNATELEWQHFRLQEHQVLKEIINNQFAFVLSTGGGIVDFPENIPFLKEQNDVQIIHIKRDNIPLSTLKKRNLPHLYSKLKETRLPKYEELTNVSYVNSKTPLHFVSWICQQQENKK